MALIIDQHFIENKPLYRVVKRLNNGMNKFYIKRNNLLNFKYILAIIFYFF